MGNIPVFPQEIFDIVISHEQDNREFLLRCSFVCQAWAFTARYYLFRTVSLLGFKMLNWRKLITSRHCTVKGSHIVEVKTTPEYMNSVPFRAGDSRGTGIGDWQWNTLPNLRSLDICYGTFTPSSLMPTHATGIYTLNLTQLSLSDVTFPTMKSVIGFITYFWHLTTLSLRSIRLGEWHPDLPYVGDSYPSLKRLTSLTLDLHDWITCVILAWVARPPHSAISKLVLIRLGLRALMAAKSSLESLQGSLTDLTIDLWSQRGISLMVAQAEIEQLLELNNLKHLRSLTLQIRPTFAAYWLHLCLLSAQHSLKKLTLSFIEQDMHESTPEFWQIADRALESTEHLKALEVFILVSIPNEGQRFATPLFLQRFMPLLAKRLGLS